MAEVTPVMDMVIQDLETRAMILTTAMPAEVQVETIVVAMATGGTPEAAPMVIPVEVVPEEEAHLVLEVLVQLPADLLHLVAILGIMGALVATLLTAAASAGKNSANDR